MSGIAEIDESTVLESLTARLTDLLGQECIISDEQERHFYSQDVYRAGALVGLVIQPTGLEALSKAVALVAEAGLPIAPRGGGMSYTSGYIQNEAGAVLIDFGRMNRILEINQEDMYVTVEAGCTWAQLYEALKPLGLRTPFWGTLSGLHATVGGGLAQNALFFGAGQNGPVTESVIGLKVVLADGTIVPTGTWSTKGAKPFNRNYGPDLTGLFVGDTGALGFKAEATFRLCPVPSHADYLSFAFDDFGAAAAAMAAFARTGIASECFGFDPGLAEKRMKRESLMKDLASLSGVVGNAGGLASGLKEAAKVAVAGRRYMKDVHYSCHLVVEGRSDAAVEADIEVLRAIGEKYGREIENSIPKITRGMPFNPLNNMIGPDGERWLPVHGFVPLSEAKSMWAAIYDLFDQYKERLDKFDITKGFLVSTFSTNAFLIEPVLYWPEELMEIHKRTVQDNVIKGINQFSQNPEASALVEEFRTALCDLFLKHKAAHLQIGKAYRYREGRDEQTWALLERIKDIVDPERRLNPGSLGLE